MLNVKKTLTHLMGRVNFSTESQSKNVTVNAGSLASVVIPLPNTKKAIGLAGVACVGTGSANMVLWAFEMQSTGTSVSITNPSTTTRTITVYVKYIVVDS